jgi:hypothetical protein
MAYEKYEFYLNEKQKIAGHSALCGKLNRDHVACIKNAVNLFVSKNV